ncbi:MAG: hypothetical protein VB050_16665 [Geobacteraceae bacterium]|nr:hypothetical protein [Geobacteraceae bacterium]
MIIKTPTNIVLIACAVLLAGCAINMPFNHRLASSELGEASSLSAAKLGPVSLEWFPVDFPNREDVQSASGLLGWWPKTRIPTGMGLASRIDKALDAAVGIGSKSKSVLQIVVLSAVSEFEFAPGMFLSTPEIDYGRCSFEAEFDYDGYKWRQVFVSEEKNTSSGYSRQTGPLEKVWDNIALQVAKSVVNNMEKAEEIRKHEDSTRNRPAEMKGQ